MGRLPSQSQPATLLLGHLSCRSSRIHAEGGGSSSRCHGPLSAPTPTCHRRRIRAPPRGPPRRAGHPHRRVLLVCSLESPLCSTSRPTTLGRLPSLPRLPASSHPTKDRRAALLPAGSAPLQCPLLDLGTSVKLVHATACRWGLLWPNPFTTPPLSCGGHTAAAGPSATGSRTADLAPAGSGKVDQASPPVIPLRLTEVGAAPLCLAARAEDFLGLSLRSMLVGTTARGGAEGASALLGGVEEGGGGAGASS